LKIIKNRGFEIPDFRTGDVLEFNVLGSKSEKIERKLSGICYQKKAPNSIRAKATINFNAEATNISYAVNLYSPMMTSFGI
jgi:ribosomal protein L19